MVLLKKPLWSVPEREITSESFYLSRRGFMSVSTLLTLKFMVSGSLGLAGRAESGDPSLSRYPAPRNPSYTVDSPPSKEWYITHYNNFYEFGAHKNIWEASQALPLRPWRVSIDGLVSQPLVLDIDTLLNKFALEERVYRLRCVEAWSLVVPWTGFPLRKLIDLAKPLGSARYVRMETFLNAKVAIGQKQFWYPWPYIEGLTIKEASHDLAFLATGVYGKPLPPQNGAPLRLAVPWKYGFKSIKSIVRFTFTETRPRTFWETVAGSEYGFWANVNPNVPHPRWSQETERMIDTGERRQTQIYNGYADHVAELYQGLENEQLFK